ncbi:MAG TPA: LPS export ABC transporter permease LptG [Thermodesulfobacteriota bacterium]|nr:LPS export ABC transporter permease LptG [Thermodesulfobacteriota bacterium]
MKILHKYVTKEAAKLFFIILVSMLILFVAIDMVNKTDDLYAANASLNDMVMYFSLKIPSLAVTVCPMAILLTALISLGLFNRHSEITAMKASGISLGRTCLPILASGLIVSAAVMAANEYVIPDSGAAAAAIEKKYIKKGDSRVLSREGVWLKHENFFYNIRTTDEAKGTISGVNIYEVARNPFRVKRRITAKSARWTGEKWVAENAELRDIGADRAITEETLAEYAIAGLPAPEELMTAETSYKNMSFTELNAYMEGLERDGFDTLKYRLELYNKISFPLVNFIMALIAIPFAVRGGRHGSIAASMSIAIMVAFSYWIISGFSAHLGQNGILPPLVSAFATDALFVIAGVFMLRRAR